jgi:hypothetical protein
MEFCRTALEGSSPGEQQNVLLEVLGWAIAKARSTKARNLPAYEVGQHVRAGVKAILAAHSPLARPLNAKEINKKLPQQLRRSDNDIRHHVRAIRREADAARS